MVLSKRDNAGNRSRSAIILGGFVLVFTLLSCHAFAGPTPPPALRGELCIVDKRRSFTTAKSLTPILSSATGTDSSPYAKPPGVGI